MQTFDLIDLKEGLKIKRQISLGRSNRSIFV